MQLIVSQSMRSTHGVWRHQICKLYQNITSRLVFMIVFANHCKYFIVLPIGLKTCRCNCFFFYKRQNVRARKIGRFSEVLQVRARPISIGSAICPGLLLKTKRRLKLASLSNLLHEFWRKIFLPLCFFNWPNFIFWLSFFGQYVFLGNVYRMLGNMYTAIVCFPVHDVKNLNTLRTKRAFNMKQKAFFIIFIGFSVAKN